MSDVAGRYTEENANTAGLMVSELCGVNIYHQLAFSHFFSE